MENDFSPDVVVLGSPSSGKTVFFSVLSLKFSLPANGPKFAPLGFRISPDDSFTNNVIYRINERLKNGEWPSATDTGRQLPLCWNVYTGKKKIFKLTSMDIAGEDFLKAYSNDIDSGIHKKALKRNLNIASDGILEDGLLDEDDVENENTTANADGIKKLRIAVANAKVVCFFVNVAQEDNFGENIRVIADVLRSHKSLAEKAIIVLTQSHEYIDEIQIKGAVSFLNDHCGGYDSGLNQYIDENKIPVIPVSAINNEKPSANPESDGLFAFLLIVSGKVAGLGSELDEISRCYLDYIVSKEKYVNSISVNIALRLPLASEYSSNGQKFYNSCVNYVKSENLDISEEHLVRICTKSTSDDEEIKCANEDGLFRFKIDSSWDVEFRKAVIKSERSNDVVDIDTIKNNVFLNLENYLKDSKLQPNDRMLFGFEEDADNRLSYHNWLNDNIDAYNEQRTFEIRQREKNLLRLKIWLFVIIVLGCTFIARYYYFTRSQNEKIIQHIVSAVSRFDYNMAKRLYDSMYTIEWLGIKGTNYFCSDFIERLNIASQYYNSVIAAQEYITTINDHDHYGWLNNIKKDKNNQFSKKIENAIKKCDDANTSYKNLSSSISFNEICQPEIDIESRHSTIESTITSYRNLINEIDVIQDEYKEYCRQEEFNRKFEEVKSELNIFESATATLDLDGYSAYITEFNVLIDDLEKLAASNENDNQKCGMLKDSFKSILDATEKRREELRNNEFDNMLSGARTAIKQKSFDDAWKKYNKALGFAKTQIEVEKLSGFYQRELSGFTSNMLDEDFSKCKKIVDSQLSDEAKISKDIIEDTRTVLKTIDKIKNCLQCIHSKHLDDFSSIESRLEQEVFTKIPTIIQIEGVLLNNQPVDIENAGYRRKTIMNGVSPEENVKCVYLLVAENENRNLNILISVKRVNHDIKHSFSIHLSDFKRGITRITMSID